MWRTVEGGGGSETPSTNLHPPSLSAFPYRHRAVRRDHANRRTAVPQGGRDTVFDAPVDRDGHREAHVHRPVDRAEFDLRIVVVRYPQVGGTILGLGVETGALPPRTQELDHQRSVLRARVYVAAHPGERQWSVLRREIHLTRNVLHRERAVLRRERQVRAPRHHHNETDRPVLTPSKGAAPTGRANRPTGRFDLDVVRDRVGVAHAASVHLNPCRDGVTVLVPTDDLDATVHAGLHAERARADLHARLPNLAVAGALSPVAPAFATIREPLIITILRAQQTNGKNENGEEGCSEVPRHDGLRSRWGVEVRHTLRWKGCGDSQNCRQPSAISRQPT